MRVKGNEGQGVDVVCATNRQSLPDYETNPTNHCAKC